MAKKYIEREAVITVLLRYGMTDDGEAIINAIPAADVVEVVRCRECRYAPSGTDDGAEQGFGLEWPEDGPYHTNPCPFNIEDGWYSHKPKPDFFCANGKRKDGGQDDV